MFFEVDSARDIQINKNLKIKQHGFATPHIRYECLVSLFGSVVVTDMLPL